MMTGNKVTPTTTCTPARIRLFQPTQRPVASPGNWLDTSWGRCRVNGRIGQRHADVLESILYVAEKRRDTDDGAIELLVDPAKVRKCLSNKQYSGEGLRKLIIQLEQVVVEIETKDIDESGHLIDHIKSTKTTRRDPLAQARRPDEQPVRSLWTVRLGLPLCHLLRHDLPLHYNPAPISALQHGFSQAVARHMLTHKAPAIKTVDGLIGAVAGDLRDGDIRNRRRELRADAEGLMRIGIVIDGDNVRLAESA